MNYKEALLEALAAKARKARRKERAAQLWGRAESRSDLVKELDMLASLYARLRNKHYGRGICEICGKRPATVAYHYIPRGHYAVRWHPQNIAAACAPCNFGEKMHRLEYRQKHIALIGEAIYGGLERAASETKHYSMADLRAIRDRIKLLIETLPTRK